MESLTPAYKNSSGQVLIEVILSLAVIILVVFGIIVTSTYAVKSSLAAQNRSLAHFYARQQLEVTRANLMTNWSTSSSPSSPIAGTPFSRGVNISCYNPPGCSLKKVEVSATWIDGSNNKQVSAITLVSQR